MPMLIERDRKSVTALVPSPAAFALVKAFEGLRLDAYPDPATKAEPYTIGFGHTGPDVHPGLTITLAQAESWLTEDLVEAAAIVRDRVKAPLSQGEFDAACSLVFNLGKIPPSLLACLNGGKLDSGQVMEPGSYGSAKRQFARNCRAGGKPMLGLYRRRLAEICVFSGLPFENACSAGVVKLVIRPDGSIDPDATTSMDETLERATRDLRVDTGPKFSPEWPSRPPAAPAQDLPAETELPAVEASQAPAIEVSEAPVASAPTLAEGGPAQVTSPPALPVPATPAKALPPVVSDPGPEVPQIKDLVKSRRAWGQFLQSFGHIFQVIGITGPVGAGPLAVGFGKAYGAVVRDPFLFELVITVAIFTTGWVMMHAGGWIKHIGEKRAKAPLGTTNEVLAAKRAAA